MDREYSDTSNSKPFSTFFVVFIFYLQFLQLNLLCLIIKRVYLSLTVHVTWGPIFPEFW